MRKKIYFIILFLLVIITITSITAITIANNDNIGELIENQVDNVKSIVGLDKEMDENEPEDKYEVVIIEINGYDELKEQIEKHSSRENKSYIFNLNDGDYNITDTISCGSYRSDSQYTINGNGHVIDGNNKNQFIELYANLKLKDLTIQNTVPTDSNSSSAITMESVSNLYIKNCNFINNYGKTKGSTLTNRGTCYITDSNFINNSVDGVGGAIWSTGQYGGSLTIKNSVFEENIANLQEDNDRTSIIYMVALGNNTLENNKFINNTGRCIHAFNQTNTNVINNKFMDNSMSEDEVIRGGLIDNYEADIHIKENEFKNDKTKGELRGGILYHEIGIMEFTDNTVENYNINPEPTNTSDCNKGGVIFNRNATATIANNEFNNVIVGNYSRGGVIYNNIGEITLLNNKFNNVMEGNNIRGLIAFNDVNSILNIGNNTYDVKNSGTIEAKNDDEKFFYNSNIPNDDGNGSIGITNYI